MKSAPPADNAWKDLFEYIRPFASRYGTAMAVLVVSMSLSLAFPLLVGVLLDAALPGQGQTREGWLGNVNLVALTLFSTLLAQGILSFFASFNFHVAGEKAVCQLRKDVYARLISLPMSFFTRNRVGDLSSRISSDLTLMQETLTGTVPQFIRQGVLMVGGIIFILYTSLKLTGVMLSCFPLVIILAIFMGRTLRKLSQKAQGHLGKSAVVVDETLQGIANVKAFGNERHEHKRYGDELGEYLQVMIKAALIRAAIISFIIIVVFGSVTLVLWYGATLVKTGEISYGQLTQFILFTTFVAGGLASFSEVYGQMQKMLGAIGRIKELQMEPAEAVTPAVAERPAKKLHGYVRFEHVDFHYPGRTDLQVLQDINIEAKPGERIALVGPSGAGKSTLVSLLLRFYDPVKGRLMIDDQDATLFDLPVLRGHMAYVPQEIMLFGGSIRENIAYGKPNATDEEVIKASTLAHCDEFIRRFPEGYETIVGERGVKVSGGQRQRIAIARALLKNPEILILDEATSSLDSESEKLIQDALETLMRGRTSFVIAHRLSTVRQVDRIYVIDRGRVVESGKHSELMTIPEGVYRRLCEMQLAEA